MREKKIEKYLVQQMEKKGGKAIKMFPYLINGLPDRLCLHTGRVWFVETKAPNGIISPIQKTVHKILAGLGFKVYILWNHEEVDMFILTEL